MYLHLLSRDETIAQNLLYWVDKTLLSLHITSVAEGKTELLHSTAQRHQLQVSQWACYICVYCQCDKGPAASGWMQPSESLSVTRHEETSRVEIYSRLVFSRYKTTRGRTLGPPGVLADEVPGSFPGTNRLGNEIDGSTATSDGCSCTCAISLRGVVASIGNIVPLPLPQYFFFWGGDAGVRVPLNILWI
jgi:hypothetical protein